MRRARRPRAAGRPGLRRGPLRRGARRVPGRWRGDTGRHASGPSSAPPRCTPASCARAPRPTSAWPSEDPTRRADEAAEGLEGGGPRGRAGRQRGCAAGGGDRAPGDRPGPRHGPLRALPGRSARMPTPPTWWRCCPGALAAATAPETVDSLLTRVRPRAPGHGGLRPGAAPVPGRAAAEPGQRHARARPADGAADCAYTLGARADSAGTARGRGALVRGGGPGGFDHADRPPRAAALRRRPAGPGRHAGRRAGVSDRGHGRRVRFDGRGGRRPSGRRWGCQLPAGDPPARENDDSTQLLLGGSAGPAPPAGGRRPRRTPRPTPVSRLSETASAGEIDTLWAAGAARRPARQVERRDQASRPRAARVPAGRSAGAAGAHVGGRGAVRHWEATSRRRASSARRRTTRPTTRSRPRRCSGSATSTPISGGGPSWIRPTARPRSPPTRSCSTAIRAPRRPSAPSSGSTTCRSDSRTRSTRRRCTTCGSRRSTRRSSTSRIWSPPTRGARWRPDALIHLVQAYRTLGYKEDVQETCGYIRRFHAEPRPGRGRRARRERRPRERLRVIIPAIPSEVRDPGRASWTDGMVPDGWAASLPSLGMTAVRPAARACPPSASSAARSIPFITAT